MDQLKALIKKLDSGGCTSSETEKSRWERQRGPHPGAGGERTTSLVGAPVKPAVGGSQECSSASAGIKAPPWRGCEAS